MTAAASAPPNIFESDGCKIQSLTVSDQHATLLISHSPILGDTVSNGEDGINATVEVQSLVKLTIVPFHKAILGCNPVITRHAK